MTTWKAIHGLLMIAVTGWLVGVVPASLSDYYVVGAFPFQVFGTYWFLKHGVQPTAIHIAKWRADSSTKSDDLDGGENAQSGSDSS